MPHQADPIVMIKMNVDMGHYQKSCGPFIRMISVCVGGGVGVIPIPPMLLGIIEQ